MYLVEDTLVCILGLLHSFTHSLNAWLLHVKPLYCPKSAKLGCIPDIKAEGLAFGGVNSLSV